MLTTTGPFLAGWKMLLRIHTASPWLSAHWNNGPKDTENTAISWDSNAGRRMQEPGTDQRRNLSPQKTFPTVLTTCQTTLKDRTVWRLTSGQCQARPHSDRVCIIFLTHFLPKPHIRTLEMDFKDSLDLLICSSSQCSHTEQTSSLFITMTCMFNWPRCPSADPKSSGDSLVPDLKMLGIITKSRNRNLVYLELGRDLLKKFST